MVRCAAFLPFVALAAGSPAPTSADEIPARVVKFLAYDEAIEMQKGDVRVVLCPQAGGRVLEFSLAGKQGLYLDEEKEAAWTPGAKGAAMTAGRLDYGPELVVTPHPQIWSGPWTAEIVGSYEVRLTSPRDEAAGMQVVRTFRLLSTEEGSAKLICEQTLRNIGAETREVCHWGRSFSPGGGICLIPLGDRPSRFPSKYAMYEDSAIINVRNVDEKICEREGFLEILAPPRKPKLGFDTYAGRLAYVMPGDLMLVKRWAADPNRVYNEAAGLTLSVWYPEGPRIELEPIGPREVLKAGEEATFAEEWQLFAFPFPKQGESVDLAKVRELLK
ncbi:MAG: hypothetical protein J0M17_25395 [Planctomycetes bacterium]|nr:hypothetical protein [Planctomycetota bacterium]